MPYRRRRRQLGGWCLLHSDAVAADPDSSPEAPSERPEQDLTSFLQRRRVSTYEQDMARLAYAYGVDLRRARWLKASSMGNAMVRAVDRGWPRLARELDETLLAPAADPIPVALLENVARQVRLLRAPLPTIRSLSRSGQTSAEMPLATPLGATHGDVNWLVLDVDGLASLEPATQTFALASAVAHLQCDHGVFFSAHLLASQRSSSWPLRALRASLNPWSQMMVFSTDRAGLLAVGELEVTLESMRHAAALYEHSARSWLPRTPSIDVRERALVEFDRSSVVARFRAARARGATALADAEPKSGKEGDTPHVPEDAWSLARVDSRLTDRLGIL